MPPFTTKRFSAIVLFALFTAVLGARQQEKYSADEVKATQDMHTSGLFMALVEPAVPVDVTFPLSDEHLILWLAAREGLLVEVRAKAAEYDSINSGNQAAMRSRADRNTDKTRELLVAAVKAGKTLQEARIGMAIAQFKALDMVQQLTAEERGKQRFEAMPEGHIKRMRDRLLDQNHKERSELEAASDKEAYVRAHYKPTTPPANKIAENLFTKA